MKKLVLFALFAFVFCCVSAAYAYPTENWQVCLSAKYVGCVGSSRLYCGTGTPSTVIIDDPPPLPVPVLSTNGSLPGYLEVLFIPPLSVGESVCWCVTLDGTANQLPSMAVSVTRTPSVQDLDISLWIDDMLYCDLDANSSFSITLLNAYPYNLQIRATALPEPGSMCGLLAGLMGMGAYLYRRRR